MINKCRDEKQAKKVAQAATRFKLNRDDHRLINFYFRSPESKDMEQIADLLGKDVTTIENYFYKNRIKNNSGDE